MAACSCSDSRESCSDDRGLKAKMLREELGASCRCAGGTAWSPARGCSVPVITAHAALCMAGKPLHSGALQPAWLPACCHRCFTNGGRATLPLQRTVPLGQFIISLGHSSFWLRQGHTCTCAATPVAQGRQRLPVENGAALRAYLEGRRHRMPGGREVTMCPGARPCPNLSASACATSYSPPCSFDNTNYICPSVEAASAVGGAAALRVANRVGGRIGGRGPSKSFHSSLIAQLCSCGPAGRSGEPGTAPTGLSSRIWAGGAPRWVEGLECTTPGSHERCCG